MPELDKNDTILTPLDVIPHHLAASSNLGPSLDAITGGVCSPHPSLYIFPNTMGNISPCVVTGVCPFRLPHPAQSAQESESAIQRAYERTVAPVERALGLG